MTIHINPPDLDPERVLLKALEARESLSVLDEAGRPLLTLGRDQFTLVRPPGGGPFQIVILPERLAPEDRLTLMTLVCSRPELVGSIGFSLDGPERPSA